MALDQGGVQHTEESTSRFVQTAKWKIHYNEAGEGHPVIMLHGIGPGATGWSNFSRNVQGLSGACRAIAVDFPGWGRSDPVDCTGNSRNGVNAESVLLLMDALGIEKAAIVGNSMGGTAVMEGLLNYPDRFSHAVTMGSGLFKLPMTFIPEGPTEGLRIIWETYANPTVENFRRLVNIMVYDPSFVTDELVELRRSSALGNQLHMDNWNKSPLGDAPGGYFAGATEMLTKLSQLTLPVMMIHGRDDRVVPMEYTLQGSAVFKNCRSVIINKCGHWAQIEHADEFNRLLIGFLQQTA